MTSTIIPIPRREDSYYPVRRVLGPTVSIDGVKLGPLDQGEQLPISTKPLSKSRELGSRLKAWNRHLKRRVGVTLITWKFAEAETADVKACDDVLQAPVEEWAEEAWLRFRAIPPGVLEHLSTALFNQLKAIPRFRLH